MRTRTRTTGRTTAGLALSLLVPAIVAACGGDPAKSVAPASEMAMGSHAAGDLGLPDGDYVAELHPLNPMLQSQRDPDPGDGPTSIAHGRAYFTVRNGRFTARIEAKGLEPNMIHPEHIHAAASCPPPSADVNGDGIVDVIEGVPFYGPILIPLDDKLGHQAPGTFPMAFGRDGKLNYLASTSLKEMLADLNAPDPDPNDAVVKLNGAPLALETRHVVLHGVDPNLFLPPSVATLPGAPAQLTLPVACGEIRRVR